MSGAFSIEVVLALPGACHRRAVEIEPGTTAAAALAASGLSGLYAEHCSGEAVFGVYGRKVAADYPLKPGERLELYRPLIVQPRQRRRERAGAPGSSSL